MSYPIKGAVIVATGNGRVTVVEPTSDNQVLTLDSTDPKGANFKSVDSVFGQPFFKINNPNKANADNANYETLISFTIPNGKIMQSIKILSYMTKNNGQYSIKIFDATHNLAIAEQAFTNNVPAVQTLSSLVNVPTTESIIEIQARLDNGSGNTFVYVREATVNYL